MDFGARRVHGIDAGIKGVDKVIKLADELGDDFKVKGIRLDSGDLGGLVFKARELLDEHNLNYLETIASGGLDEHKIAQLIKDNAPIDGFGVGTGMAVSDDASALDAVKNDYETILVEDGARFIDRADADKTRQELKEAGVIFK